eukprot:scaffold267966_cov33-Prasinocladus_malaysianus.AAC.1
MLVQMHLSVSSHRLTCENFASVNWKGVGFMVQGCRVEDAQCSSRCILTSHLTDRRVRPSLPSN